jgi:hypothetical protein
MLHPTYFYMGTILKLTPPVRVQTITVFLKLPDIYEIRIIEYYYII